MSESNTSPVWNWDEKREHALVQLQYLTPRDALDVLSTLLLEPDYTQVVPMLIRAVARAARRRRPED